jgi:two-component system sensor histidine kinase BarA
MPRNTPISTRISRIVTVGVATGISVSVGIFLVSDFRQAMKSETARYQSAAYAFAAASSDGVAERDPRKVLEVIRGVRNLPDVAYIAALEPNGNVVAEIGTGARLVGSPSWWQPLVSTTIEVLAEVRKGGTTIGSIALRANAQGLSERYRYAILYAALLGAMLVAVTSAMAKLQVGRVIKPLRDLSSEFVDIGRRSDLTRRLTKERDDEVGVLVDAFNEMFSHIDDRDRLLQKHRETLEETVDQRTAELRLAKDEADAANAAKSNFLATMSHEIRTPMNGMMVMAEMLAAAPLSPKHLRYAEIISRSGKNLVHIINDILDISKIESGKIELEQIEFSVDAVVEDVVCLFAERAREKGLSLGVYISPEVPVKFVGDPVRLMQVISNLVNNGLKFTETGGVAITVELFAGGDQVVISVEDSGTGISAEQIDRIFTRFSQADVTITRKFGGTGLGLSISKQLTELMGGTIRVESAIGQGSCFVVSVPLAVAELAKRFIVRRPVAVTLYDDDVLSRRAIARSLEARGVIVMDEVSGSCEAVIIRAGTALPHLNTSLGVPLVLLRPFAATSSTMPAGIQPVAEIPLPLSRTAFDLLCAAMEDGNLATLVLASSRESVQIPTDLRRLKVLAVDDVAVNREVLAEALRTFNIECDLAESGLEAIAQIRAKAYDVIFMDCSMPDMDGFEASRKIRDLELEAARPSALIVALTGQVIAGDGGDWKDAGMNAYLPKPFNIAQLNDVFQDLDVVANTNSLPTVLPEANEPLLSPETLAMFETIRTSTGTDVQSKVFAMFRDSALQAYSLAADEIAAGGGDAKRLIHALKSNCSSSGAARATSQCQAIETALALGQLPADGDLDELKGSLIATIGAMVELEAAVDPHLSRQATS